MGNWSYEISNSGSSFNDLIADTHLSKGSKSIEIISLNNSLHLALTKK
jgi:hypothetical protein